MSRMRHGRGILAALLIGIGMAAALALGTSGCGKSGTLAPNTPPETVLFVSGPVDTVNHIVTLRWAGSDPDGRVDHFEYKWIYAPGGAPAGYDSTVWTTSEEFQGTFTVYTPSGYSMPTFVLRAVDDEGTADPTPVRQDFQFRNEPPTVQIAGSPPLPATTLPVVTVRWNATDPDGDVRRTTYLVWLDGDEAGAVLVPPGNEYTLGPTFFSDGAGGYVAGPHTLYVRAIDEGGAASPPDTASWVVAAPQGDVLLVDDLPASQSAAVDPAYRNALTRQLPGGSADYTILDLETANPFRSSNDIAATFRFFRSVVWYQEINTSRSATLAMAEQAIRDQLVAGGNVYVCSQTLVGTNGAVSSPLFLGEIVGADSARTNTKLMTTNFTISNAALLHPAPQSPYDSLSSVSISTNVDALALRVADDAAFLAYPIVLDSSQTEPWVVGIDRVPAGGAGRFVFLTFPLRFMGGTPPGAPSPAPDANYTERTLRRILYRFGHGAPP